MRGFMAMTCAGSGRVQWRIAARTGPGSALRTGLWSARPPADDSAADDHTLRRRAREAAFATEAAAGAPACSQKG